MYFCNNNNNNNITIIMTVAWYCYCQAYGG